MKRAVFLGFVLIVSAALVICGITSAIIFDGRQTQSKQAELIRLAHSLAGQFDPARNHDAQADDFASMLDGIRVTIIAADGRVTGDSEADFTTMENHLDRAEILEARATKAAVSIRQSSTVGRKLMYAVIKLPDGTYLRLAEEYDGGIAGFLSLLPAIGLSVLLSLLAAAVLAGRFSRNVTGPLTTLLDNLTNLKDGSASLDPESYPYEELRNMVDKMNALSADIGLHIGRLQDEKDRVAFILDNMKEGFLLLDDKQNILLINNSACLYLRCGKIVLGQNLIHATQDLDFLRAAEDTVSEQRNQSIDITVDGRVIEAQFTFANEQRGLGRALIIIMADVTESRNAVKMRRDFFTNAGHELKTPITSIKGSVELLCAGLPLEEEKRRELLERMGLETERMHSLINDILMINRMESGEIRGHKEQVDFALVVRECHDEIIPMAESKKLSIEMELEPAALYANHKNMHEMVSNLLVNAVKYNKPGGKVDVSLKNTGQSIVLSVRNDGDPIPPQHQCRVFERFYRVEKGRSKTMGGTGLGLSIVKHVVDGLGGTIRLESNREKGTTITVTIPFSNAGQQ